MERLGDRGHSISKQSDMLATCKPTAIGNGAEGKYKAHAQETGIGESEGKGVRNATAGARLVSYLKLLHL